MVDIPDDIDLVDYDEEDPEEEPEEDVDIELEDDAELIFPYEVEGDKTPPPGDVSSDSVSSDSESEDEEVDVAPEATVGTITQKPYVNASFPRGLFEVGESSSARDSSHVDGLAPWALRRDLEASRAQARVMEAELEWGECHMKKRLVETKTKGCSEVPTSDYAGSRASEERNRRTLLLTGPRDLPSHLVELVFWSCIALDGDMIMPPKAMSEARMREVIREQVAASMAEFMANMNRGAGGAGAGGAGAGGAGAGGARAAVMKAGVPWAGCAGACGEKRDAGAGGAGASTEGAMGLCQWFEKLESVFRISDCKERDKVKFATATLQGRALTWWNGRIASMGIDAANGTPWTEVRKWMTEEFCPRSVLQRLEQELLQLEVKKGTDIDV
ncbi:hypothetical protein Tco_0318179 [Tanacetum coccineum]